MRQYKIYNRVQTDPSRKSEATFGCNEWFRQQILIGTSSANSFHAGTLEVNCFEKEDNTLEFTILFEGIILKRFVMDRKTKEMKEVFNHQEKTNPVLG